MAPTPWKLNCHGFQAGGRRSSPHSTSHFSLVIGYSMLIIRKICLQTNFKLRYSLLGIRYSFSLAAFFAPAPCVALDSSLRMQTPGRHDLVFRSDLFLAMNNLLIDMPIVPIQPLTPLWPFPPFRHPGKGAEPLFVSRLLQETLCQHVSHFTIAWSSHEL